MWGGGRKWNVGSRRYRWEGKNYGFSLTCIMPYTAIVQVSLLLATTANPATIGLPVHYKSHFATTATTETTCNYRSPRTGRSLTLPRNHRSPSTRISLSTLGNHRNPCNHGSPSTRISLSALLCHMSDSSSRSYLLPSHPNHLHPSYSPSVPLFSGQVGLIWICGL